MINFNTAPYFDDYSEDDKFYRILFRPSFAVQARELTQLQTILQTQIRRHGDHIFKEGAMVIPGQMSIDNSVAYVKLQQNYNGVDISLFINNLVGQVATGDSGITAQVIAVSSPTDSDPATLYVKYTNSADDTETKTFVPDEVITIGANEMQVVSENPVGLSTIASIQRGVYYTKGFFVLVQEQTIILEKYSNASTCRVGLNVIEQTVGPEDPDYEILLDNARGSYNFAAPGAHRYFIDLVLSKRDINSEEDENFIELLQVENGKIKRHTVKTEYSELEKTMARRTYDESGDYVVRNFTIDVREHRNNDRQQWQPFTEYLIDDVVINGGNTYVAKNSGLSVNIAPTHTSGSAYDGPGITGVQWEYSITPYYNRGVYRPEDGGNESKLAIGLDPGKAYVQGYEIEKLATEFVEVNKSRDFVQVDNAVIPTTIGNYILVKNTNNLPPVHTYGTVTLYDRITGSGGRGTAVGTAVGTARVRFYEWHNGSIGSVDAVYKMGLFDVKMFNNKSFDRIVKSVYVNVSNDPQLSFTADIEPEYIRLIGSASASASTIVTGTGTSFQTDLQVGDYIRLGSEIRRVTSIVSQNSITVDTAVTVSGVTVDILITQILEPENIAAIFQFPYYAIKSVRSALGTNDTTYTVYERFTGTSSVASGGTCTLTISTSSGTFASAAETDNYIIVNNDATSGGSIIEPIDIVVSSTTATFVLPSELAETNFIIIGTVNKSGAALTEKTKTLSTHTVNFTSKSAATKAELLLGKADAYRIISVMMDSGTFDSPSGEYNIDIRDRYDFDDGQRITHYDLARLNLKASYLPPAAPVQVTFEYFSHSTGDYFTVNSYPNNVKYSAIPLFDSVELRDFIDFRPRISDDGTGFSAGGSSMTLMPKRGLDVRADFQYYLARKCKIGLDFAGNFYVVDGVSALNPGEPQDTSMGMILYDLTLEPYTFSTTSRSVTINPRDNRRYTMRDIGKLEKRIDNLEYYTSLSLLEQQTETLDIIDADGETRFKNGFIVDNFTGHTTGDTTSPDYMCAIDMENGELRPFFSMQNINLIEKNTSTAQRLASNYQLFGDVITLPVVDHIPLVSQTYASRLENINPFAIFTFLGNVELTPSSDDWFEIQRRPDLVIEVEGNFNTIKTLAEKAGVLGTVWNSWQTQWTGRPVTTGAQTFTAANPRWGNGVWANARALNQGATQLSFAEMQARFGVGQAAGNPARQVTVQTSATQIGQSRTGVKTTIVAKIDRQVVADRVLSTATIPYIRSRNILVQVKGLKPNTRFYAFFDNIDVSSHCTPASKIVYTQLTGEFDDSTNVGGLANEAARRISGDAQVCLTRGDVIRGQTSGATAVVVGIEVNTAGVPYALHVVNIIGNFIVNETIVGSVSGATGRFTSVSKASKGGNLVTNTSGDVSLLFNIPNTSSVRFRTGSREFKLVDTNQAEGQFTSRGRATYHAEGVLETRQQTVNAVRNAQLVREQVSENRVIVQTSQRVVADTGWYDPLAQTFLVTQEGGAFLTKVDVYFATKDPTIPVNLEIREVVNGYPGKLVLPFSNVSLKPSQVKISSNKVLLDGVQTPKYDTPTTFVFPSPVYVQHNAEYALVLSSDSNNYKVWISQMGDVIPGSSRTISEQPYQGVLFKSQNASTWTADQMQDLKFTIYRAKFATNVVGNVEFINDSVPYLQLDTDPFEMAAGVNKIRIYHQDHGMTVNSRVIIGDLTDEKVSGYTGTGTITTSTTNTNITGVGTSFTTQLKVGTGLYTSSGQYLGEVANVTSNTTATLVSNSLISVATQTFKYTDPIAGVPANQIYGTRVITDVDLDSYCISVSTAPTSSGYFGGSTVRATQNVQYDEVQPLVQVQTFPETLTTFGIKTTSGRSVDGYQTPYIIDDDYNAVLANDNNKFLQPRMIASDINESTSLSGNKSVRFNVTMRTDRESLSPVLDTQRMSLVLINNKVNFASEADSNIGGIDDAPLLVDNTTISFDGTTITSSDEATREILQSVKIGKYITISGSLNSNNGTFLVIGITNTETDTSVVVNNTFNTESSGNPISIDLREYFVDEIAPVNSSTYSKYVTRRVNLATPSTYLRIRFAANIPTDSIIEVYYKASPVGSNVQFEETPYTKIEPDSPIVFLQNGDNTFLDMNYSEMDMPMFDAIQVKLVMKSRNSSAVPRVRDLRIIACA